MYAPSLYQTKYIDEVWKIPAKNYGLMNLVNVFSIFASLSWSSMADRTKSHKNILILKSLLYAAGYMLMFLLEPFIEILSIEGRMVLMTGLFFLITTFCSAIFPMLGTLVFVILESDPILSKGLIPPKRLLGRQKLFGTLGLGMVYMLNGTLTDLIGFRAQFLIVGVTSTLFAIVAYFGLDNEHFVQYYSRHSSARTESKPASSWKNISTLVSDWNFALLLLLTFLVGVAGTVFNLYYSVFMGKILVNTGWKNTLMGYMYGIRLAIEIPIYIWGDVLLGTLGSYGVLFIALTASVLRPFGYALVMTNESRAYWGFVLELLKGVSHSCNAIGGCVLASDIASVNAQSTAQALFTSAHHHAASTIGGLLCALYLRYMQVDSVSRLEQILIYRRLFFATGILATIGSVLNFIRLVHLHRKKTSKSERIDTCEKVIILNKS